MFGGDALATGEFKRRLTAILSADVKGYSRLMRDDEERPSAPSPPIARS
ncbi:MAG: hypothetical protein JXL84_26620 [Deltaproteobacteria bacterium]|nr:hypothetical protein [Deltaproteobacteria bacterium]